MWMGIKPFDHPDIPDHQPFISSFERNLVPEHACKITRHSLDSQKGLFQTFYTSTSLKIRMKSVASPLLALAVPILVLGEFEYGKPRVPEITAGPLVAGGSLDERAVPLTIEITNKYGAPMSIAFDHNAGGPEPIGGPLAPKQLGASSTQFAFPTGWAGVSITPLLDPKCVY